LRGVCREVLDARWELRQVDLRKDVGGIAAAHVGTESVEQEKQEKQVQLQNVALGWEGAVDFLPEDFG